MSKNYVAPVIVVSLLVLAAVGWLVWQNSGSGNASTGLVSATPSPSVQITETPAKIDETPTDVPLETYTPTPSPKVTTKPTVSISIEPTISY